MGVEPPPSFFSGKFFGITERPPKKNKRNGSNSTKAGGSGGQGSRKGSSRIPTEAPNDGGSGDANPNSGGADGSGGGDDKGDKKKDDEARKLAEEGEEEKEKEKEKEKKKKEEEEEEEEAKRKEMEEEERKAREAAQGSDPLGNSDEAGPEVPTTRKSKKGKVGQYLPSPTYGVRLTRVTLSGALSKKNHHLEKL